MRRLKTYQLQHIWRSEFGADWARRNYLGRAKLREPFWAKFLEYVPEVRSVIEIGCNVGMNLHAISKANPDLEIIGMEPNNYAYQESQKAARGRWSLIEGDLFNTVLDKKVDMVFTCTLLIHIHPEHTLTALKKIYDMSNNYILSMEYYWPWPKIKELKYRGLKNALWKRDFGALWLKHFNLKLLATGYVDARDGFDRTTWWLLKKRKKD